jgi:hypothetical protein
MLETHGPSLVLANAAKKAQKQHAASRRMARLILSGWPAGTPIMADVYRGGKTFRVLATVSETQVVLAELLGEGLRIDLNADQIEAMQIPDGLLHESSFRVTWMEIERANVGTIYGHDLIMI